MVGNGSFGAPPRIGGDLSPSARLLALRSSDEPLPTSQRSTDRGTAQGRPTMTGTRQTVLGGRHRAGAAAPPRAQRPPRLTKRTGRALLAGGLAVASATGGIVV